MKSRTFIQRHPVATHFVLAFVISWGGSIIAVGSKFVRGETNQLTDIWLIGWTMLVTVSFLAVLVSMSLSPELDTLFYIIYSIVLWGAALIVIARYGRNLVRVPGQAGVYKPMKVKI